MVTSRTPSGPDPIKGTPSTSGAGASRNITPDSNPVTGSSDGLGTISAPSSQPLPPPVSTTPIPPPPSLAGLLEQVVRRVNAVDSFGKKFGLSREARRELLGDVDENFPIA